MCGIAGFVDYRRQEPPELGEALNQMVRRGPDGSGIERIETAAALVGMGHRRLAILDLSEHGHQPMSSAEGAWCIAFNGEIYNHLEIRKQLPPRNWRGHSDTETLVEALGEWGLQKTLAKLEGMFAFAALDRLHCRVHLVRDPFGIKPLYVARTADGIVWASQLNALLTLRGSQSPSLEPAALATFLSLRYVPSPLTLLEQVERIPPGHVLSIDLASRSDESSYFAGAPERHCALSPQQYLDEYEERFTAAVQAQMLSDVPVGILLSGGIDSALLAAMTVKLGHRSPTFSVGFGAGHAECELQDAAQTAAELGLANTAVLVNAQMLWGALGEVTRAIEEPLGTTSVLPMWFLSMRAREDVTVVLTGQGSDEPWGGYGRYKLELLREKYSALRLIPPAIGARLAGFPGLSDGLGRGLRAVGIEDDVERFWDAYKLFTSAEQSSLFAYDPRCYVRDRIDYWKRLTGSQSQTTLAMMGIDARMNLADDLLLYADKVSMAFSLEARVPMLHLPLMRWIEALPLEMRTSLGQSKILHRRLARKFLPPAVIERRKKGFQVPFAAWSRTVWRERIEQILLDESAPHFAVLDRAALLALWKQHVSGKRDMSRQMFALLMLAVWWSQLSVRS